jgi:two-component system alkaline phosphatase synthesis response regulator PhoP
VAKILVVDDEPSIVNLITSYLKIEGHEVFTAADGPTALKNARGINPDLVILDVMLPGIDGLEVLSQLRRESDSYVILLTARTEETDKIVGLSLGADDYVTKPFSPRELTARVKAALRRLRSGGANGKNVITIFSRVTIDTGARSVSVDGNLIDLTAIEYNLLAALAENRGRVLTREMLLEKVWGYGYYGDTRVVDVHMGHVRHKLGVPVITTVRGVGYRFDDVLK